MTHISSPGTATRLGENHGYRFEGDFVHLNAEVNLSAADLSDGQSWALQLWASDSGFADRGLAGVKVAEMPLQPMAGSFVASGCCTAMPPAGAGNQVLGLALVACADDRLPQVLDLAVYAADERFSLPRVIGNVSCTVRDGFAELAIDAIANPRGLDNVSGTLALEVWALDAPYAGGAWAGSPVASVVLGVLNGGDQWTAVYYKVPAAMPIAGAALTVMLREWTPAGYVTRDYRNFAAVPAKLEVAAASHVDEAATVEPEVKAEAAPKVEAVVKATPAPKAKPAEKPAAKAKAAEVVKVPVAVAVAEPEVKPAAKAAKKATVAKSAVKQVSVNRASEAELCAVKGLPPSVARAIVAGRPFATLDEVCKAKGMGPKMLTKLRDQFVL